MSLNLKGVHAEMARVESPYWNLLHHRSKKKQNFKVFFFTVIGIALISALVALVVAWLLAGGVIDPQDQGFRLALDETDTELIRGIKEPRVLDYQSSINQLTEDVRKVASQLRISEENLLEEIFSDINIENNTPDSIKSLGVNVENKTEPALPMSTISEKSLLKTILYVTNQENNVTILTKSPKENVENKTEQALLISTSSEESLLNTIFSDTNLENNVTNNSTKSSIETVEFETEPTMPMSTSAAIVEQEASPPKDNITFPSEEGSG